MAVTGITIDWQTRVISVDRDYLGVPTQVSPSTIYSFSTDDFRLDLKELEASVAGMSHLDTHSHNTQVPLGGVIYARVIEIINSYTVTFEDGQYAVNLFGSNNNIGDVINVNQVSVRTNNAAGLIVDPGIQESLDYGEQIVYDEEFGVAGSSHPVGTYASPVNNNADLQILLTSYGRAQVLCLSDITLTQNFSETSFISKAGDENFYANGFKAMNCSVNRMIISGDFNHSKIFVDQCAFNDVQNVGGTFFNSIIFGDILQTTQYPLMLKSCSSAKSGVVPVIIDMIVGEDAVIGLREHSGPMQIINCDTSGSIGTCGFLSGVFYIEPSCTDGGLFVSGIVSLEDSSTTGCTVDIRGLIDPDTSNTIAYDGQVTVWTGSTETETTFPVGTNGRPTNNLADAIFIANQRGIGTIHIKGDYNFLNGTVINDFIIRGDSKQSSTFTFETGSVLSNCHIEHARCSGDILDVYSETDINGFSSCHLIDINLINLNPSSQDVVITDCLLEGHLSVVSGYTGQITLLDCYSAVAGQGTPTFNVGNSTSKLVIRDYAGGIKLINSNQSGYTASIDMSSGNVIIDSSIIAGTFVIRGLSDYTNNSTTANIITTGLLSPSEIEISGSTCDTSDIAIAVWDYLTSSGNTDGSFGILLKDLVTKSSDMQHSLNVNTELLKNKPNNP